MRPDFDRLAEIYDETRFCPSELTGRVVNGITDILGHGASLLDIGTGTGRFLASLSSSGMTAFGVDLSAGMIGRARSKGLTEVAIADGCRLPFPDKVFDGSLLVHVLHLVDQWTLLLGEAARVARKAVIAIDISSDASSPYIIMRDIFESMGLMTAGGSPTEGEFAELCAPDSMIDLGSFEEVRQRDEVISAFERRSFPFQAAADESEHERAMMLLSDALKADEIVVERSVEMLVWEPRRISLFVRGSTFG